MLGQQQIRPLGNGKFQTPAGVFNTYAEAMASLAKPMSPALRQPSYGDKLGQMADPLSMMKSDASVQSSPFTYAGVGGLLGGAPNAPEVPEQPVASKPSFMDRLTSSEGLGGIGSMMLAMSNDPSLQRFGMAGMEKFGDTARAKRMQNRTVQALRDAKRDDIADAVESGLLDAKSAASLLYAKNDPKVVGKSLVVPDGKGGVKVLFTDPENGGDATTAFNTLKQRALAAGLKEGSQEFKQFMIDGGSKAGFALRTTPDGGIEFVQGGASLKPLNEGQAKATGFYGRMTYLSPIIDKFEQQGTQLFDSIVKGIPIAGNYLTSNEYKQYMYAKDNWIAAQLRDESGAAIGTDEYVNADKQYFPQVGDSAEVIEQKRQLRKKAQEAMKTKMGGPANQSSSTEDSKPTGKTVKVGDVVNGYRFKGGSPSDPNSWEKV